MITEGGRTVADVANEIFDLDLDWGFSNPDHKVTFGDLKQLSRLCIELSQILSDDQLHSAVWMLSEARNLIGYVDKGGRTFETAEIDERDLEMLEGVFEMKKHSRVNGRSGFERHSHKYPILKILVKSKEWDEVFANITKEEAFVLRRSGINQKGTSIIIERIKSYKNSISNNIAKGRSVSADQLSKSTIQLRTLSATKISRRISDGTRSAINARTVQAKDKVIGLTTLWADALTLLTTGNYDVTGVFSTAAGATIAAIHPRGTAG